MDRKQQLQNVSFGGAWSEQIAGDEMLTEALDRLDRAVNDTVYEDIRGFEDVRLALDVVCGCHPKGAMLAAAWARALNMTNAGLRAAELARLTKVIRAGLGDRIAGSGG